jgi:hypothetical protein
MVYVLWRCLLVLVLVGWPSDVAFPGGGDPDRGADGPVDDLPILDLDHNGVDEHHRVGPVTFVDRPISSRYLTQDDRIEIADGRYQPWYAHAQAHQRRRRPRSARVTTHAALRAAIAG